MQKRKIINMITMERFATGILSHYNKTGPLVVELLASCDTHRQVTFRRHWRDALLKSGGRYRARAKRANTVGQSVVALACLCCYSTQTQVFSDQRRNSSRAFVVASAAAVCKSDDCDGRNKNKR